MKFIIIAGLLLLIAVAIATHQYITWGAWFEFDDLHHESWIVMFAFAGVVLLAFKRG